MRPRFDIGVDTGGTFTDIVARASDGTLQIAKIPTNSSSSSLGLAEALDLLARQGVAPSAVHRIAIGTTVATNAVIERTGARVGLITTHGFRDVLEMGRQGRQSVYAAPLKPESAGFLVPRRWRREVRERISSEGLVVQPLNEDDVRREAAYLAAEGVDVIAVVLLYSFLNSAHEMRAAQVIRSMGLDCRLSLSCQVDPMFREYERTLVTAFDAYLKPPIDGYLAALEGLLKRAGLLVPLRVMQSTGGLTGATVARRRPVRLFLSGPAAGVVGAQREGMSAGFSDLVSIDIGGTSADIAVVRNHHPLITDDGVIAGYRVRIPMVDVNAIGAGGGSIAWIDGAGSLRVGPRSAGSNPGPAAYGRGGKEATVTDASIVLGYLNPGRFAGGSVRLEPKRAFEAIARLAENLGLGSEQAALGIHRIVNSNMAEGIRAVSIERGVDPRSFPLVALGGAGPVHAMALASELGISTVIVPRYPGVQAAIGLLEAPVVHEVTADYSHLLTDISLEELAKSFTALDAQCIEFMADDGVTDATRVTHYLRLQYEGQSHYLEVQVEEFADGIDDIHARFNDMHDRVYGHAVAAPIRTVQLRAVHMWVEASGPVGSTPSPRPRSSRLVRRRGERMILTSAIGSAARADIYWRPDLVPGDTVYGPAIVEQEDTTVVVLPGWCAKVDAGSRLIAREYVMGGHCGSTP